MIMFATVHRAQGWPGLTKDSWVLLVLSADLHGYAEQCVGMNPCAADRVSSNLVV